MAAPSETVVAFSVDVDDSAANVVGLPNNVFAPYVSVPAPTETVYISVLNIYADNAKDTVSSGGVVDPTEHMAVHTIPQASVNQVSADVQAASLVACDKTITYTTRNDDFMYT